MLVECPRAFEIMQIVAQAGSSNQASGKLGFLVHGRGASGQAYPRRLRGSGDVFPA